MVYPVLIGFNGKGFFSHRPRFLYAAVVIDIIYLVGPSDLKNHQTYKGFHSRQTPLFIFALKLYKQQHFLSITFLES